MKKLNFDEMEMVQGGLTDEQAEDLVCLGLGTVYGLVNPAVGFLVGLGCVVYYWD